MEANSKTQFTFSLELSEEINQLLEKTIEEKVESRISGILLKEPKREDCNLSDAEEITGLKRQTLYKLTMPRSRAEDKDPLPFYKSGKFLKFKRTELQSWCERRFVRPGDSSGVALTLSKSALRKR